MSTRTHHGPGRTRQSAAYIRRSLPRSGDAGAPGVRGVNDSNTLYATMRSAIEYIGLQLVIVM